MRVGLLGVLLTAVLPGVFGLPVASAVSQPAGYRLDHYDAPVPAALEGAQRVSAVEVRTLMREQQAVVIDVIPEHRRPEGLPENQIWMPVPHTGIAGALWLPDVGYGVLSPVTERYFVHHIARATGNDLSHAIVFYCRMDCWMSWNAAKRALSHGYRAVYWFADGLDDWRFEDFDLTTLTPAPGPRQ